MTKKSKPELSLIFLLTFTLMILQKRQSKIIQVIQIIRHGVRTPYVSTPTEEVSANMNLTNRGFDQITKLGLYMRKRYAEELEMKDYNPLSIKVVPSSRKRCVYSAKAYLYGFFWSGASLPTHKEYRMEGDGFGGSLQVIPEVERALEPYEMESIKSEQNFLFRSHSPTVCPNMKEIISKDNFLKDEGLIKYVDKIFELLEAENFDPSDFISIEGPRIAKIRPLYDYLYSLYFSVGSKAKKPISMRAFKMIETAKTYIWYKARYFRKTVHKACATKILQAVRNDIVKGIEAFKKGSKTRKKLVLYSGQDSVLYSVLNALEVIDHDCIKEAIQFMNIAFFFDGKCRTFPKFGDHLTFEVSHIGLSFLVRLYYNGSKLLSMKAEELIGFLKLCENRRFMEICFGPKAKEVDLGLFTDAGVDLQENLTMIYEDPKEKKMRENAEKRKPSSYKEKFDLEILKNTFRRTILFEKILKIVFICLILLGVFVFLRNKIRSIDKNKNKNN